MVLLLRILILFFSVGSFYSWGQAGEPRKISVLMYGGAATSASLLNIIKVSLPDLSGYAITTVGGAYEIAHSRELGLEWETQVSKHWEQASAFSLGSVFNLRWLILPWDRWIRGSFAIGNGLSYSTEYLDVETSAIGRTSKLLYHIILEYEFALSRENSDWSIFVRDHHRSGIFGVFDGVVGGSDFICLGLRYRPSP